MSTRIISREQAKTGGLNLYFTGRLCKNGHISERRLNSGICLECEIMFRKRDRDLFKSGERPWPQQSPRRREISIRQKESKRRLAGLPKRKNLTDEERKIREERRRIMKLQRQIKWHQNNPFARRLQERKRRALKRKLSTENVNEEFIINLKEYQNNKCVYCQTDITNTKFHIDHRTPLVRGGGHIRKNLQLLCPPCNLKKGRKTHEEFLDYLANKVSIIREAG